MSETTEKPTFQPLDAGDYLVRLNRFNEKTTKNGAGKIISAGFEVVSGESKGRLIFHNFLVDDYLKAVGAGGLEGINNDRTLLEQWTEIPFVAVVNIEDAKSYQAADGTMKQSKARNNIKKFMGR